MAPKPIVLKVSNRPGKRRIKNLPPTLEIDANTTVEDAKKKLASAAGVRDFNRVALFEPTKQTILKDRLSRVVDYNTVIDAKEVMVRDLGYQISWKGVFIFEYIGPILTHSLVVLLRPYIYRNVAPGTPISQAQLLTLILVILHFIKRELETIFLHRFGNTTMPLRIIFKNSGHYWILSGIHMAYWVYSPTAIAARPLDDPISKACVAVGLVLFFVFQILNFRAHVTLSKLRKPGGTERGIPKGFGFNWVTCPNYLFEFIVWFGILLISRSWSVVLFMIVGSVQMQLWAIGKEKLLRKGFPDTYKPKKYPFLPGLPFPERRGSRKGKSEGNGKAKGGKDL